MKSNLLAALVLLTLLVPCGSGIGDEKSAVSAELQALVTRIQTKLAQGKNTKADLAPELEAFESLRDKYKAQRTYDVANVLWTEATLYLQVLDDCEKSRALAQQLRDFPKTTQGKKADDLLAMISQHEEVKQVRGGLVMGGEFPGFDEKDVDRKSLSLSSYQGKVVLLNFWATWSKPCIEELPNVLAVYEKYHTRGFEIIGVNLDQDELRLTTFTVQNGIRWQQFTDGKSWKNKLAVQYGITSIPANYLVDRHGKISGKDLHGLALEKEVARALVKK